MLSPFRELTDIKSHLTSALKVLKTHSIGLITSGPEGDDDKLSHVGKPRLTARQSSDWGDIVQPLFKQAALAMKSALLKQRSGDPSGAAAFFADFERIQQQFPTRADGAPTAADLIYAKPPDGWPLNPTDRAVGLLCWLHWNRFRIPLWQDGLKARSFDVKAMKRVSDTMKDFDERQANPTWKPKVKIDLDHAAVFELGLSLGLELLPEEELAACFDAVCPCGKEHSGDALRKQRDRLIADLQKALVWEIEVAPSLLRDKD
ncbi:MAG TPA: hypothetical protein VGQ49_15195 [Bryobacteraceae bacterium]|jgi:hypothetical protein|nr:hypothetical protein [Bryobacteraceae bacterium]